MTDNEFIQRLAAQLRELNPRLADGLLQRRYGETEFDYEQRIRRHVQHEIEMAGHKAYLESINRKSHKPE